MDVQELVKKYLTEWKDKKEYLGALITGSRAAGIADNYSDADILIVLSDGTDYKERGNKIVDDIVVEYIACPESYWYSLFEDDVKNNQRMWIAMWRIGKIVEDTSGVIAKLKEEALTKFKTPIEKLSGEKLEMTKYQLWDGLENLKSLYETNDSSFNPTYYLQLSKIIGAYSWFNGVTMPAVSKWSKYFQNEFFRGVYGLDEIRDKYFTDKILGLMTNPNMEEISKLTEYVLEKVGGFRIDGWVLREKVV
jgi:hypothetical protein